MLCRHLCKLETLFAGKVNELTNFFRNFIVQCMGFDIFIYFLAAIFAEETVDEISCWSHLRFRTFADAILRCLGVLALADFAGVDFVVVALFAGAFLAGVALLFVLLGALALAVVVFFGVVGIITGYFLALYLQFEEVCYVNF